MADKKTKKKKKTAGDVVMTIVLVIAIGVFCFAAYNLYQIYAEYKRGTDEYNSLAEMAVTEMEPEAPKEQPEPGEVLKAPMTIDFQALRAVNEDVVGWIYMEGVDTINYPIVQGADNDTYLHTTYEGNYNIAGAIFVDYENKSDFSDCNTIVYGHNMKNGSMFGSLKQYIGEEEAYKKSKYFWIFTPQETYRYEILAAYITPVDSDTYTLFPVPGGEFVDYLNRMKSYSEIETEVTEFSMTDKIITLSTCTGNDATRFVVQGKRVNTLNTAVQ